MRRRRTPNIDGATNVSVPADAPKVGGTKEALYTLEKCQTQGHDYDIISEWPYRRPAQVLCSRCGRSWAVAEEKP